MPETSCWCRLTRLAAWADIAMQARASGVRATSWRERFLDWITLDLPMGWTRGRHRAGRSLSLLSNESTGRPLGRYPLPAAVLIPGARRTSQGRGATGRDGVCHRFFRSFLAHEPPSHRNRSRIRGPSGEQPRTRHGARPVPLCRIPSGAGDDPKVRRPAPADWITERSEEHTSELQSLMRISYAVFCLKKKKKQTDTIHTTKT